MSLLPFTFRIHYASPKAIQLQADVTQSATHDSDRGLFSRNFILADLQRFDVPIPQHVQIEGVVGTVVCRWDAGGCSSGRAVRVHSSLRHSLVPSFARGPDLTYVRCAGYGAWRV